MSGILKTVRDFTRSQGNVRDFDSCQGNIRDFIKSQGNVREVSGKKSVQRKVAKNCLLLVAYFCPYGFLVAPS